MIFHRLQSASPGPTSELEAAARGRSGGKVNVKPVPVIFVVIVLAILILGMLASLRFEYPEGATTLRELIVVWVSGAAGMFFGERLGATSAR